MRIVAGRLKGMSLSSAVADATRPTSDKVREAIFSMLYSRIDLDGLFIADLYAGTGALGLEAFSRGAQHVTFVETDKKACLTIEANVAESVKRTGVAVNSFEVLRTPVLTFVNSSRKYGTYDVVFADPPYDRDIETELLSIVAQGGILVYETSAQQIDVCEKTLAEHELVKEVLVSRTIGAAGVLIVEVV